MEHFIMCLNRHKRSSKDGFFDEIYMISNKKCILIGKKKSH